MLPAEEPDSYDGIIFGSAGGVDSFFDDPPWIVGEDSATVLPAAFCIGRYTAWRWKERTGREAVCADNSTAEGIVRKIIETFS
jgi:uroporphyrinogen-III synthase